ncbi:MAG TPA: PAS domain S-box protein, partial [Candidatus Saccharimonadia bacterium]|nr:PAS domain S-box protein [Candidatus Saccharimonadia bacterium]
MDTRHADNRQTLALSMEDRFRGLVEQSIVGIYILQDERFVYVNPHMAKILGRTQEEMTSRSLYDFIAPDDRAITRENIRRRITGEVPSIHYHLRMLHRSGAVLQVEVHGTSADYNGRPAVIGTLLDVTERQRTEEELTLFRALIDQSNDVIEVIDPESATFLDVNEMAVTSSGYTREELLSMTTILELVMIPDMAAWQGAMEELRSV